jgi:molybdopterin/thiamine biosynthesis adenylyltransferase/nitroreductase
VHTNITMYQTEDYKEIFLPVLIKRKQSDGNQKFNEILKKHPDLLITDFFASQKKELFKIRNPKKKLMQQDLDLLFEEWIKDKTPELEGTWVYYPWTKRMLHIVEESEFVQIRTNRNHYRISPAEQSSLSHKTIGIIGLSVGHSVAVNIATERICGKLKLADFDTLELSNLNRIKTGLHNIGLNKCIITAREIAEIDPFIEIECYTDGITQSNLADFITAGGKLDVLIDECDDLEVKVTCREMAKSLGIPVLMETSDRGMLDVERFDLDRNRPIFHGLLKDTPLEDLSNIKDEARIPLVMKIVNAVKGSLRGRLSLLEVGQTIGAWPQLASAVTLGGGVVTDVCRRLLLKQFNESGRYYVDLEEIIGNKEPKPAGNEDDNPFRPFDMDEAIRIADSLPDDHPGYSPQSSELSKIVEAACQAPSTGNDQPWKWLFRNGRLHLFHDRYRSFSFGDFDNIASNLSFGAAYENLLLKSNELGFHVSSTIFPLGAKSILIAVIEFHQEKLRHTEPVFSPESVSCIFSRSTNRNPSHPIILTDFERDQLKNAAESVDGASFFYISDKPQMMELGKIIGECDRIRLLNPRGHRDFVHREMKWTKEEAEKSRDGIDIRTLGMSSSQMAALSMIRDKEISKSLKLIKGGTALIDVTLKTISTASGLGIITLPRYSYENFFKGGISLQRLWLRAESMGFAIHPLISPFYLFPRIMSGNNEGLDESEASQLRALRERFLNLVPVGDHAAGVFLFKIAKADKPEIMSYRLPLEEVLFTTKLNM